MFDQSERASAIVAATILDELLEQCLTRFLREDKKLKEWVFDVYKPLSSLKAKTDLAYLLGILSSDERSDLDIIRKIRNDFAHQFDTITFASPNIGTLCGKLKSVIKTNPPPGLQMSPLDVFRVCTGILAYRLSALAVELPRVTSLYTPLKPPNEK